MDISSILRSDAAAIYIGNLSTVDADLILPDKGKSGSAITWVSDYPYTVGNDGKVIRPHAGTGDREVILTAHLSYGDETLEKKFTLTVLARELNWTATRLLPTEITVKASELKDLHLPGVVIAEKDIGGFTALAVQWNALPKIDSPTYDTPDIPGMSDSPGTQNTPDTSHIYRITGTPPLEKQPELVPEAIITVTNEDIPKQALPKIMTEPFPYSKVQISGSDSIFAQNKRRMLDFLLSVNDDSMLYNFRVAAGLDTKNAPPMTGWDAPECLLKGHTTGHYLSALAFAVCGGEAVSCKQAISCKQDITRDEAVSCREKKKPYKDKIRYMIAELSKCQDTMEKSGQFKKGFLSGYPEDQFDLLEQYVTYPSIWAPYYTLHKIIAGLLDCYEFAGETEALTIVKKLGLWMYDRLESCGEEKRGKMWSMYIAGEYGGMNEAMARLYKLSPKPEYLQTARFFDNTLLFWPMEQGLNTLPGMHGNQHIPQMVGAVEMYARTAERRYYDAAKNFWKFAVSEHAYSIGGVGEGEMFREPGRIAANLTDKTAESCASYNMLKLTAKLYCYTADSAMVDYYERTLYNHIAASHDQSGPVGGTTYFMPLSPGGKREFDTDGNTCCHGTGLENHLKYQEMIYHQNADTLYINLFIPSVLNWTEKGIKIHQHDGYLENQAAQIIIEGSAQFKLLLRVPGWLKVNENTSENEKAVLLINGTKTPYKEQDGYAVFEKDFNDGDIIRWQTPFTFRFEPSPDDPAIGSIMYGPLVMAADSDTPEFLPIGGINPEPEATEEPLTFTCGGYKLRPNYTFQDRPYHVYVKSY
ncbi:MAG: glycoside hydrolase family 127 protein [Oscillospiraceae bacterium]|jgi:DUF1680 family protein|nr:glycoside hydrolase family 127 protein [Oscillospiraceae bacterium]